MKRVSIRDLKVGGIYFFKNCDDVQLEFVRHTMDGRPRFKHHSGVGYFISGPDGYIGFTNDDENVYFHEVNVMFKFGR